MPFSSSRSSHPWQKLIKRDIFYKVMKMDPLDFVPWRNITYCLSGGLLICIKVADVHTPGSLHFTKAFWVSPSVRTAQLPTHLQLCYFNSNQAGVWPLSHMGKIQGGKVSDTVASVDRFHLTDMFLALVHWPSISVSHSEKQRLTRLSDQNICR